MAADLKSISLSLAVMAGFAILAGAVIPSSPGHAQEQSTVPPAPPDISPGLVEETLLTRGNTFLEAGDFASARVLYQAAANQGSGQAAMLTGVTYDPRFRELAGISEPESNAELARQWYALAMRRGDTQAERNDLELVKWLKDDNIHLDTLAEADAEAASEARPEPEPKQEQETPAVAEPHQAQEETTVSADTPTPLPVARPEAQSPLSDLIPAPKPGIDTAPQPGPAEAEEENTAPDLAPASAEPSAAAPARAAIEPTDVPIVDARVARAQLTSAVKDREPVDRLPSSIQVSDGRVERIVFFSEVHDLAGQTLSHRWERQGETMADVSFVIGSGAWRMHSAKRVTAAMTGQWRVVVVDEVGAELASVPFVLE